MLKFGTHELGWAEIAQFNAIEGDDTELSLTTTDNVALSVGIFPTQSDAQKVKAACEASKVAYTVGGVVISIIIDDL